MIKVISGFISIVILFFVVLRPIEANLLASIAKRYPISSTDKAILLAAADQIDPCNYDILNTLGDTYVLSQNITMAIITYGNAMVCSPGNSLARFKFGESLLMMNFIQGRDNIKEAILLEPHNPIYRSEINRLMAFQ